MKKPNIKKLDTIIGKLVAAQSDPTLNVGTNLQEATRLIRNLIIKLTK